MQFQTGSSYSNQIEDTDSNFHLFNSLATKQNTYRQFAQSFHDLKENLDTYRNSVSKKLDELHMSLQRPKVPMYGPPAIGIGALANTMSGFRNGVMRRTQEMAQSNFNNSQNPFNFQQGMQNNQQLNMNNGTGKAEKIKSGYTNTHEAEPALNDNEKETDNNKNAKEKDNNENANEKDNNKELEKNNKEVEKDDLEESQESFYRRKLSNKH